MRAAAQHALLRFPLSVPHCFEVANIKQKSCDDSVEAFVCKHQLCIVS